MISPRRLVAVLALVGLLAAWPAVHLQSQTASEADRLFQLLELGPGMTGGEIGAGRGEMTVAMAERVGPSGTVYSTELDPDRLDDIRRAVSEARLENVTVIEAGARSTNLPDACCDAIFMQNVYHHFTAPAELDRDLFEDLKPGGRLVVIDFEPRDGSSGPDGVPANRGGHGVPAQIVVDELTTAGLSHTQTIANWPDGDARAARRAFLVLFRKPDR